VLVFHTVVYGALVSVPISVVPWKKFTEVTATLSDAVALSVTEPLSEAPAVGAVSDTFGAVVSAFATVTVMRPEVPAFAAASRATAFNTYEPFASTDVFHDTLYGALVSVPISVVP
jgi:hypothetical protein